MSGGWNMKGREGAKVRETLCIRGKTNTAYITLSISTCYTPIFSRHQKGYEISGLNEGIGPVKGIPIYGNKES